MSAQNKLRILVVDDEKPIRDFLRASLASRDYCVIEAACGKEALRQSVDSHPDVIVLDLGLPDMEGREVICGIRKRSVTPIIILSVRDDPAEKIAALDAGADDYLTKPFSCGEFFARLRAVIRRVLPADGKEVLKTGRLVMDITKRLVTSDKREISLTPTEYDILKMLLLNPGKVITHRQLLRGIWDKDEDFQGIMHLLRVTISNLRAKIEPDPCRPVYLLTEPGVGYRLRIIEE